MFITILVFIIILGILILVHELGHFIATRMFGVKAEEFGLGYPPRMLGWVKDDNNQWKFIKRKDKAESYQQGIGFIDDARRDKRLEVVHILADKMLSTAMHAVPPVCACLVEKGQK